jgi:hypothetical protein
VAVVVVNSEVVGLASDFFQLMTHDFDTCGFGQFSATTNGRAKRRQRAMVFMARLCDRNLSSDPDY